MTSTEKATTTKVLAAKMERERYDVFQDEV